MKPSLTIFSVLAAACLLTACGGRARHASFHNGVESVEAEGYAPYNGDATAVTAAAALEAQKNAIETVADLFASPVIKAEKYDQLKRRMLESPQLYVKRSKVLFGRREGNLYRVTVRAYVHVDKIASALKGLAAMEPAGSSVSGALMFDERIGNGVSPYGEAGKAFASCLSRKTPLTFLNSPKKKIFNRCPL